MDFVTPDIKHIGKIKEALQDNDKKCCEMSVGNTVLWSGHYGVQIAFWEENIIYRKQIENGAYSYCCNLTTAKDAKKLFDFIVEMQKGEANPFRLHCVSMEEMEQIEGWYPGRYRMVCDRDDSDYLYDREKLATLAGKKLHAKRNHIHRFEEEHSDWVYEKIYEKNKRECEEMVMQWCEHSRVEDSKIQFSRTEEAKLVIQAIEHCEEFGLIGGAIRSEGRIIAITLGERLTKDTFVVHFEKANAEIQGAYALINREFVRHELSEYRYVNREEDLGIEGLRKAKLSYHPETLIAKGIVTEF